MCSYIFKGATVVDGSGAPPYSADVAIKGDRIVELALCVGSGSGTVINASGLVLAPGFIDIHSHSDMTLFKYPLCESKIFQGVTTEVTGNCGLSLFPMQAGREQDLIDFLGLHDFSLPEEGLVWNDLAQHAAYIEHHGAGINLAPLVGHCVLRIAAMGMDDRRPTAAEMERMQELLELALKQGAWGMSTGLIYPPGSYAATEELVGLAKTLASFDALYTSHIRSETERLFEAIEEAIAIGRESGARIQISHLKAMGKGNRGRAAEALNRLAQARLSGVDVAADQYPYEASATTLTAVVPQWAHEGGAAAMLQRLRDPALQERIKDDIGREMAAREGAAGIMISNCGSAKNHHLSGKTIAAISVAWECPVEEVVIRLIDQEQGAVGAIFFSMAVEDVATILADPQVAVGSDGHGLNAAQAAGETTHPRSYGSFARVLGRSVREDNLLSLPIAVHKMTGLPAARLGFSDRGLIRPGFAADLVLFDPATIHDCSEYADPHHYAGGVIHVFINGQPVLRDGEHTGIKSGKVLKRGN
ncbi:MAG TPA: D-aminoacylase [Desulfuromonadaceae bacterium]|jgi:N-acyl-D-amino-acid deacylase